MIVDANEQCPQVLLQTRKAVAKQVGVVVV